MSLDAYHAMSVHDHDIVPVMVIHPDILSCGCGPVASCVSLPRPFARLTNHFGSAQTTVTIVSCCAGHKPCFVLKWTCSLPVFY